jgi:hypothetical protein
MTRPRPGDRIRLTRPHPHRRQSGVVLRIGEHTSIPGNPPAMLVELASGARILVCVDDACWKPA